MKIRDNAPIKLPPAASNPIITGPKPAKPRPVPKIKFSAVERASAGQFSAKIAPNPHIMPFAKNPSNALPHNNNVESVNKKK